MQSLKILHLFGLLLAVFCTLPTLIDSSSAALASEAQFGDQPTSYFEPHSLGTKFDSKLTLDQYLAYSLRAVAEVNGFDTDIHRYDSSSDLAASIVHRGHLWNYTIGELAIAQQAGNNMSLAVQNFDELECGRQLDWIINQLILKNVNKLSSTQLNIIDMLDSFGSSSSQLMMANNWWLGSFQQCVGARLPAELGADSDETRYCIAKLKSPSWTQSPSEHLKLAVCLPKTCSSTSFARHSCKIEKLIRLVRPSQEQFSSFKLVDLYCLPSEDSPLRQLSLSARIFVALLSAWFAMIAFYSLKYEYIRIEQLKSHGHYCDQVEPDGLVGIFAIRLAWRQLFATKQIKPNPNNKAQTPIITDINVNATTQGQQEKQKQEEEEKISGSDSAIDSISSRLSSPNLSQSSSQESLDEGLGKQRQENLINSLKTANEIKHQHQHHHQQSKSTTAISFDNNYCFGLLNSSQNPKTTADTTGGIQNAMQLVKVNPNSKSPSVDLSCIDGIKVISMLWLIAAHTLLYLIRNIANGRQFWSILRDPRFMTIMAGIFPVDTFFTITGILTTFLRFNKGEQESQFARPKYWLETFFHRYARFMPMYSLVFWYTRDVSEYIGSGPMWDYATANTSIRSMCKRESIIEALFFRANLKPLQEHCVKPAWYLASDFQFLLVTPFFLFLLAKSAKFGQATIVAAIIVSLILQFVTVFTSDSIDDFATLINFKPMFGAYILKNLWKLYVLPYNRICPYLIGLLTGYYIYNRKITHTLDNNQVKQCYEAKDLNAKTEISSTASLWKTLRNYFALDIWYPLICLISIVYLPLLTLINTYDGIMAKIGTSALMGLMRFVWSLAIARVIYICTSQQWKTKNRAGSDSFVRRFLSSPIWKPWSKMGLCALLIQWEVISYFAQIQTSLPNMTFGFLLSIISISAFFTYLVALIAYLTIEYPISLIEQRYIHPILFR